MNDSKPALMKVVQLLENIDCHLPQISYGELDGDDVFTIICNKRRRALLYEMATEPGQTLDAGEAANRIAEHEFGPEYDYRERKSVYINLIQSHIPMLKDHGVIECNRCDSGTLSFGENAAAVLDAYYRNITAHQGLRGEQAPPATPS